MKEVAKIVAVVLGVWIVGYLIDVLIGAFLLWLISLATAYTFQWIHAFILGAVIVILCSIFKRGGNN